MRDTIQKLRSDPFHMHGGQKEAESTEQFAVYRQNGDGGRGGRLFASTRQRKRDPHRNNSESREFTAENAD